MYNFFPFYANSGSKQTLMNKLFYFTFFFRHFFVRIGEQEPSMRVCIKINLKDNLMFVVPSHLSFLPW